MSLSKIMTVRDFARLYQKETGAGLTFSGTDEELLQSMIKQWQEDSDKLQKYSSLVFELSKFKKLTDDIVDLMEL